MRRIESTRKAIADFDAIYDFIAKESPRAATDVLRALDRSIQLLADQPKLGRIYRNGRHRLRLLIHGNYLVFYRERPRRRRDYSGSGWAQEHPRHSRRALN